MLPLESVLETKRKINAFMRCPLFVSVVVDLVLLPVGGICVVPGMEMYMVESRKRAPLSFDQMTDVILEAK